MSAKQAFTAPILRKGAGAGGTGRATRAQNPLDRGAANRKRGSGDQSFYKITTS